MVVVVEAPWAVVGEVGWQALVDLAMLSYHSVSASDWGLTFGQPSMPSTLSLVISQG